MWLQFRRSGRALSIAVALAASVFGFCGPAWSQNPNDYPTTGPVQGGSGGSDFIVICPPNTYWMGITGNAGNTIEKMQLWCAPFHTNDAKTDFVNDYKKKFNQGAWIGVGGGGSPDAAECDSGFIKSIQFNTEVYTEHEIVDQVQMHCQDLRGETYPDVTFGHKVSTRLMATCTGSADFMVGLKGRMGNYVDAIAGVCAPMPLPQQ